MGYSCHICGANHMPIRVAHPLDDIMVCAACRDRDWEDDVARLTKQVETLRGLLRLRGEDITRLTARIRLLEAVREAATCHVCDDDEDYCTLRDALVACDAPEPAGTTPEERSVQVDRAGELETEAGLLRESKPVCEFCGGQGTVQTVESGFCLVLCPACQPAPKEGPSDGK